MAQNPVASRYCCITIQQMLDDIAGGNSPYNVVVERNGFLDAVMSDTNTAGFSQVQTVSQNGKARPVAGGNRRVEIEYAVRNCQPSNNTPTQFCDTTADSTDDLAYSEVTVEGYYEQRFALDENEFRQLCEGPNDRLARLIMNRVNDLKRDINNDLIARFISGLGNYSNITGGVPVDSAVSPRTLNMFNNTGQTNGQAFLPVWADYRRSGYRNVSPIAVGGTFYENWMRSMGLFNGNDEGLDASRMQTPMSWIDDEVDITFADAQTHLITWIPGYIQMTEWYQYQPGSFYEKIREDYQKTTLTMDGFTFDYALRYDECTEKWQFRLSKYYDLFKVPTEAFSTDCLQYSNTCLNWLLDCGDIDCTYLKL